MPTTGYRHGVYTSEKETSLLPSVTVNSAVVFAVGTAAVQTLGEDADMYVNEPRMYQSYEEFVAEMGWSDADWESYTLQQLAYSHFALYHGAPIIVVNVFDPSKHRSEVSDEEGAFSTELLSLNELQLAHGGVAQLTLKSADELTTYQADTDYVLDATTGLVTRLEGGEIPEGGEVKAAYTYADPTQVTADDIIGGVDVQTGKSQGLELIGDVYSKFGEVPSIILAPKYCEDPDVAIVMAAKCEDINGLFQGICIVDVPTSGENAVTKYSDVTEYKNKNNLIDDRMIVCWPHVQLSGNEYGLSTHLAGLMAQTDGDNDGIPYESPSNKVLSITSCGYRDDDGEWQEIWLSLDNANYLNGEGIYTVSNFNGGLRSWGGRMACYPSNTDPKDAWDSVRRFFNWYQSKFILTYFQKVDKPMTRRLVQTILKSEQVALDGYTAREIILGGSIEFNEDDNPATDLIDGIMRFALKITPPVPARDIEATFEFDTDNLSALFG